MSPNYLPVDENDVGLPYGQEFESGKYVSGQLAEGHYYVITPTANRYPGQRVNSFNVQIFDRNDNNKNVTSEYIINKDEGTVVIARIDIEFTAKSATAAYDPNDQEPLTCNEIEITVGALLPGHYVDKSALKVIGSMSKSVVGACDNIIDVSTLVIRDAKGDVVTDYYNIKTVNGTLVVEW
jgi:hypothetical protein